MVHALILLKFLDLIRALFWYVSSWSRTPMWNRARKKGKMISVFAMHIGVKYLERSTLNTHPICFSEGGKKSLVSSTKRACMIGSL